MDAASKESSFHRCIQGTFCVAGQFDPMSEVSTECFFGSHLRSGALLRLHSRQRPHSSLLDCRGSTLANLNEALLRLFFHSNANLLLIRHNWTNGDILHCETVETLVSLNSIQLSQIRIFRYSGGQSTPEYLVLTIGGQSTPNCRTTDCCEIVSQYVTIHLVNNN
jgi:hypothetical protein